MTIITKTAEECNAIPPAIHSVAAIVEGAFQPKSTSDRSGDKEDKIHSFSRTLAREIQAKKVKEAVARSKGRRRTKTAGHCANYAILLKYLAHRAKKPRSDGRRGFYITLRDLATRYPYLQKSAIWEMVKWLQRNSYVHVTNQNTASYDRTFWYTVPKPYQHKAEQDLLYFHADVAKDIGVAAAVLADNFNYWIGECEKRSVSKRVIMSPTTLTTLLPFGADTIERGMKTLVATGRARKLSKTRPIYGNVVLTNPAKADSTPAEMDKITAITDRITAETDNNTPYVNFSNSLETPSKEKPSAFENETFGDVGKQTKESDLMDNDTKADEQDRTNGIAGHSSNTFDHIALPDSESSKPIHWPTSLQRLHDMNHDAVGIFDELQKLEKGERKLITTAFSLAEQTLAAVPLEDIDRLYANTNGDEVLQVVLPYYQSIFDKIAPFKSTNLFQVLFYGSLECVVGAFLFPRDRSNSYSHPFAPLVSITYEVHLKLWKRADDLRLLDIKDEFDQRKKTFASVDESKETDSSLAPAEKMRVFRNALNARNKVGWIFYDQEHRTGHIVIANHALKLVEKFFSFNPRLVVADLLSVHDLSMAEFVSRPLPETPQAGATWYPAKGVMSHVRRGYNLFSFITNLHHIVRQLGMEDHTSSWTFLKED